LMPPKIMTEPTPPAWRRRIWGFRMALPED